MKEPYSDRKQNAEELADAFLYHPKFAEFVDVLDGIRLILLDIRDKLGQ